VGGPCPPCLCFVVSSSVRFLGLLLAFVLHLLLSARCARAGRSAPSARCSGTVPAAPRAALPAAPPAASRTGTVSVPHTCSAHDCHCFPHDLSLFIHAAIRRLSVQSLRGQSRIRYSLPPPGFSESGIHLASANGKPLGFLWIHVQGGIHEMGQTESRFGRFFFAAWIAHVGSQL